MAIIKRPQRANPQELERFINSAPDAPVAPVPASPAPVAAAPVAVQPAGQMPAEFEAEPTRKTPISLTMNAKLLEALDAKAKRSGISRAAAFALAARQWVDAEK